MVNQIAQLKKIYDSKTRSAQVKTFSEEELAKVKADSYTSGFEAGKNDAIIEATNRQELMQKELIYNLQTCVDKYLIEQSSFQANLSSLILTLSVTLFKKTFPTYASKVGLEEISDFIKTQLLQLQDLPELFITVHPENLKNIMSLCNKIVSDNSLKIHISVKESAELELSDCTINWESGYLEKKLNNILDSLSLAVFESTSDHINE